MKEKRYILLKDIPLHEAGTVFVRVDDTNLPKHLIGSIYKFYAPEGYFAPIYSDGAIQEQSEWFQEDQTELANAIKVVCRELKEDGKSGGSYYCGWKDNISCCMQDEFIGFYRDKFGKDMKWDAKENLRLVANKSAERFLDMLIYTSEVE